MADFYSLRRFGKLWSIAPKSTSSILCKSVWEGFQIAYGWVCRREITLAALGADRVSVKSLHDHAALTTAAMLGAVVNRQFRAIDALLTGGE